MDLTPTAGFRRSRRPGNNIAPECAAEVEENFERLRRGKPVDSELRLIDAKGRSRYIHIIAYTVKDNEGQPKKYYGSIQDITDIKQAQAELLLRDRCLANASDGIVITDPRQDGNPVIYCNKGFTRLTGYEEAEVLGRNCRFLQGEDTDKRVVSQISDAIVGGESCTAIIKNYRKDGSEFWNRLSITPVMEDDSITHFIGVLTDFTETMNLSRELSYRASHDPLTDLINRSEFEARLEQALHKAVVDNSRHMMCYLDLDSFKIVNDTAGHIAGDELLRQLPAIFRRHVRAGDSIARLGGDEFGILLENCNIERAMQIANDILLAVENYRFIWEKRIYRIGCSLGLVEITSTSASVTELFKHADAACYIAKDAGGNRLHSYQAGDLEIERRQVEMEAVSLITQGLDDDRFFLDFQSIKSLNAPPDPGEHFEVLLRLRGERGDVIYPGHILPAAERFHLSPRLDQWVIRKVFQTLTRAPVYLEGLFMCSINLSGISVNNDAFLLFVEDEIKNYGIPAEKICFEITETAAIQNMSSATRFIERLKEHGCHFSLDDFGSGLSSFAYLATLPVDFVKIDGQFVRDLHENAIHRAMIRSIHEMATIMRKQTIAEFVENDLIVQELEMIGINYIQGFGVSKPQSLDKKYPA